MSSGYPILVGRGMGSAGSELESRFRIAFRFSDDKEPIFCTLWKRELCDSMLCILVEKTPFKRRSEKSDSRNDVAHIYSHVVNPVSSIM